MVDVGIDRSIMPQPAWTAMLLTSAALCLIDQAYRAATGSGADSGAAWIAALVLAAAMATGGERPCPARATARRTR
jgi:hypothetical protein